MPQRFTDSENSEDDNWCCLWETPSKKSQRRFARAWVHPLPGDIPISEALAIPKHPIEPSEFTAITSNVANQPEDQFLLWRQEMEAKQEEQAQEMAELHEQENRLREENERLRTRLESSRAEKSQEPPHQLQPFHPGKGKEAAILDDVDLPADDELSSDSSPLPRRSPSPNAAEAQSKKMPPRQSNRSSSVMRCRVRREPSMDNRQSMPAHEYVPNRETGTPPPVPSMYPLFGAAPAPHMIFPSAVRGP